MADTTKAWGSAVAGMLLLAFAATADPLPSEQDMLSAQIFGPSNPTKVGEVIRLTFASPAVEPEPLRATEDLPIVWSETITYPGASYIAPHFSRFVLPDSSSLVVRSPDGSRRWEYTGFGKAGMGTKDGFWGIHIPGDTAVLELRSRKRLSAGTVVVDSFAYGYSTTDLEAETEAVCGADDSNWAKCYQSTEATIYTKSRAVARLLINGTSACTGWLIGDQGHVITNQHCIGTSSDALNTDYEFMAEGSTCSTNCASWFACPGTVVATSGTLVKSNSALDYALVRLPTNPTSTYGYLQLRSSGALVNERIYIPQHPSGWGKRIAVNSTHSSDGSGKCEVYNLNAPACTGGSADVGYFCDTRGGSSGSPVLGYSDHLVVALHHCANCPNRGVPIQSVITDLGSSLPSNALPGSSSCVPVQDSYISHFTGLGCKGEEHYYTPYFNYDGIRRSWDGQGCTTPTLRTVSHRSYKDSSGTCYDAWPSGNTLSDFVAINRPLPCTCGEESCAPVEGQYISHFTGLDCTGEEHYYTPYFSSDGIRRTWDGGGCVGRIRRTVTNRSYRASNGICYNAWPSGNTLNDFVKVYR
jgi:hypothetical protein